MGTGSWHVGSILYLKSWLYSMKENLECQIACFLDSDRPDVQYDLNGYHVCVEFDHDEKNSEQHVEIITSNYPKV